MPSEPIFLHVGLPKTGTTELQKVLWENRRRLAELEVVYPGPDRGAHFRGALDVLGIGSGRKGGAWASLVEQATASTGRVVLSHEMLAGADEEVTARIAADLAPRDLHVVVTMRDFSRIVSATWQERAKNREVEPWGPFLAEVGRGPEGGHPFWRLQDAPRVIRQWAEHVPGENIHVITVPPVQRDPHLLLRRFAEVVGFSLEDVQVSGRPANQSLGALEIAVLQHVNEAAQGLDWDAYRHLVKNYLVKEVLAPRRNQIRVVLPENTRGWVEAEAERVRESVRKAGCWVVGDLSELDPQGIGVPGPSFTDAPDVLSTAEVLEASSEAIVALVQQVGELRARPRRSRGDAEPKAGVRKRSFTRRVGSHLKFTVRRLWTKLRRR